MSERLIRLPELMEQTGLTKFLVYKYLDPINGDATFPQRRYINGNKKIVVFLESEVQAWIANQVKKTAPVVV